MVEPSGAVLAQADHGPGGRRHTLSVSDHGVVLTLTDTASVTFGTEDDAAELHTAPSMPPALLPVLIAGPVLVTAAVLAGHDLMHASATHLPELDGAAAFAGPPGIGKSSVARLVSGTGRHLLSDDALRIDTTSSTRGLIAHRGTTGTRLRGRRHELVTATAVVARAGDGRTVVEDESIAPPTAPLRIVALPRLSSTVSRPRIAAVPRTAAVALLASASALEGASDLGLISRQLALAAAVAHAVPVVELWLPWASPLPSGLADDVRTLLADACGRG